MTELTIGKTMFMIMNIVIYQILGFFLSRSINRDCENCRLYILSNTQG